jgi:hypothetical protein
VVLPAARVGRHERAVRLLRRRVDREDAAGDGTAGLEVALGEVVVAEQLEDREV